MVGVLVILFGGDGGGVVLLAFLGVFYWLLVFIVTISGIGSGGVGVSL